MKFSVRAEFERGIVRSVSLKKSGRILACARIREIKLNSKESMTSPLEVKELVKRYLYFSSNATPEISALVLEDLSVNKEEREKGYGQELMRFLVKRFFANYELVLLEACPKPEDDFYEKILNPSKRREKFKADLDRLIGFYEQFGFKAIAGTEVMSLSVSSSLPNPVQTFPRAG